MNCGENVSLQVLLNHEKNIFFCESMANTTEDTAQPAENKCDEVDEPSSPADKGKQVTTKSKVEMKIEYFLKREFFILFNLDNS